MQSPGFSRIVAVLSTAACLAFPGLTRAGVDLPGGGQLDKVDFERHVMGIFGKAGCNNGSCHGSFQGKNGFRLSLFGYEPQRDFAALTRDLGRRFSQIDPDSSLLLQKAIGSVKHDGGARFSRGSWQYNVMRAWIAQGAQWTKDSGKVVSLSMTPKEYAFCEIGKTVQVRVSAKFADGSAEDITPFCDFRVQDDAIAVMSATGLVTAARPGDSGLAILYRGNVIAARILVPSPVKPGFQFPALTEVNFIDREVDAKLRQMNVIPSDLASDAEFLRRVYVDTIGNLPSPDEVRSFLADKSPIKRERLIDKLLAHPLHAALWATNLSDITGNNTDALENPQNLRPVRSQQWHDWLRKRLADNMPYDEIVRNILTATSREGMAAKDWVEQVKLVDKDTTEGFDTSRYVARRTLDLFWRRQQPVPPDQWGQKVAAAFMGVRLECAECHKHPTDRWTQNDYQSFAAVFNQVTTIGFSADDVKQLATAENDVRKAAAAKNQYAQVRELYVAAGKLRGGKIRPDFSPNIKPKALLGPEFDPQTNKDLREELFKWLSSPENPFFARSFVNRIWAHYLGVGLVDPVDDFSLANPPTNARLLDLLAKDFVDGKYDIRAVEKRVLMSRTYQTSAKPNESNKFDKNNFARSYIRPMMAEVVVDVLNSALEVDEPAGNNKDVPAGKRIVEIGSSRFQNQNVAYALRIFGRPPRTTACDCERVMEPALPQTLYRMTDQAVLVKLKDPKNRIARLLKSKMSNDEILDELFLSTLSRLPSADEKAAFAEHSLSEKDRSAAFINTMWALINTREFVLNH